MTRKAFVVLLSLMALVSGCGGDDDDATPTTTSTTASVNPRFDPSRPETALVPIPNYQYGAPPSQLVQLGNDLQGTLTSELKAAFRGSATRSVLGGGTQGVVYAWGFDRTAASASGFHERFVSWFEGQNARTERLTLAGEETQLGTSRRGNFILAWHKGPLAIIVSSGADRAKMESVATALINANKA